MIALLNPILLQFLTSKRAKRFLVECLEALAKKSDNDLDDAMVAIVKKALLPE